MLLSFSNENEIHQRTKRSTKEQRNPLKNKEIHQRTKEALYQEQLFICLTKRNYKEPMLEEDYELIEHPRLELHLHVATKFVQVPTHELNVCVILGRG